MARPKKQPAATQAVAVAERVSAPRASTIKVQATKDGYFDDVRRRPGDVFRVRRDAFSTRWMREVDPSTPEKLSTSQQVINQVHDDVLGGKVGRDASPSSGLLAESDELDVL